MSKIVELELPNDLADWLEAHSVKTTKGEIVSQALRAQHKQLERRLECRVNTPVKQAEDYLRDMLRTGQKCSADVVEIAGLSGITYATLKRAKYALGVKSVKEGFSKGGKWHWRMDE